MISTRFVMKLGIAALFGFVHCPADAVRPPVMAQYMYPPSPPDFYYYPPPPPGYEYGDPYQRPARRPSPTRRPTTSRRSTRDSRESDNSESSSDRKTDSSQPTAAPKKKQTESSKSDAATSGDSEIVESANPRHGRKSEELTKRKWLKPDEEPAAATVETTSAAALPESADGYISYVYSTSDSLASLARACGWKSEEILRANNLRSSQLRDGQVLRLPKPSADASRTDIDPFTPERQMQREIWRGIRGRKQVALTFDAGGEDDGIDDLLGHLTAEQAPGTFFITGQFVEKNAAFVKQIADAGFPIHNHSWSHPEFTKVGEDKMREELERTDQAVRDLTGKSTKPYWRPPFGDRDRRVLRAAGEAGYRSIYWTLDSLDSVGEKKSRDFIIRRITSPPKSGGDPEGFLDGAIILMHVGEKETAAAVPGVIRGLRDMGFSLVTVDDILRP